MMKSAILYRHRNKGFSTNAKKDWRDLEFLLYWLKVCKQFELPKAPQHNEIKERKDKKDQIYIKDM